MRDNKIGFIPDFTGGLERALFSRKTSPRHFAAAARIKDVVQFSKNFKPASLIWNFSSLVRFVFGTSTFLISSNSCFKSSKNRI